MALLSSLNYWAILVSFVSMYVIGELWYMNGVMGKSWQKSAGLSDEQVSETNKTWFRMMPYRGVVGLVMLTVIAVLIHMAGLKTATEGAWFGFLLWLGFAASFRLMDTLVQKKPFMYWINVAMPWLLSIVVASAIIAAWQ